jgi:large subunit ribosomal protein L22
VNAVETQQEVRAVAKWVRMSPRKARLVTQHIRGRSVPEARTVLAFTQRAAAREIEKVLHSAVANAEANHGLTGDDLIVSAAYVDEGPVMKRWRARARGRVARIKKPTCHITIKLVPGDASATAPALPPTAAPPVEDAPPEPVTPEEAVETEAAPEPQAEAAEESQQETEEPEVTAEAEPEAGNTEPEPTSNGEEAPKKSRTSSDS